MRFSTLCGVALAATIWAPVLPAGSHHSQAHHGQTYGTGMGAWMHSPPYRLDTVTTVRGTVHRVNTEAGPARDRTEVIIRTPDDRRVTVWMAPTEYLAANRIFINRGDDIEVTGSLVTVNGRQELLARDVRSNQYTVALRTISGDPRWMPTTTDVMAREATITGTIRQISRTTPGAEWEGKQLLLQSDFDHRMVTIFMGAPDALRARGLQLNPGDRIQVTGSMVEYDRNPALLARQLQIGPNVIALTRPTPMPGQVAGIPPGTMQPGVNQPVMVQPGTAQPSR